METMTNMNEETIEGLKDLVRVNIDSAEGFESAADKIDNAVITEVFKDLATQRSAFATELRKYVELNDEEAADSSSIKGTLHRWWLELRGTVSGGDAYAVLAEAERGEDVIKERYEEVLKDTAGSPVNDVLLSQYTQVKKAHDRIRDTRDAFKDAG